MSVKPLKNPLHVQAVKYMKVMFKAKKTFTQKEIAEKFKIPLSTVRHLRIVHCNISREDQRPTITKHIRNMMIVDPRIYSVDEIRGSVGGSRFKDRTDESIVSCTYAMAKEIGIEVNTSKDYEMTFKEIGLELKISEAAARKSCQTALNKLNAIFADHGITFEDLLFERSMQDFDQ